MVKRDFTRAEKLVKLVLDREPDLPEALNALGSIYEKIGKFSLAETLVKRALKIDKNLNYEFTSENDFGLDWGNITSSLRWNHLFSNKLFSNTTLTYSKYQFNTLLDSRSSNSSSFNLITDTTHFNYFSELRGFLFQLFI